MTESELMSEMNGYMHGKKAVTIQACRLLITPQALPKEVKGWHKYMIGGVILSESEMTRPDVAENGYEMWECELVIIPKKRHFGGKNFHSHRIDQVMTGGGLTDKAWESEEEFK